MEDLKKTAKSFLDRLSSASLESIENGWKMFALAYLNADLDDRQRESEAPALFRIIHREYLTALERSA
jgi:hypothetical protein